MVLDSERALKQICFHSTSVPKMVNNIRPVMPKVRWYNTCLYILGVFVFTPMAPLSNVVSSQT